MHTPFTPFRLYLLGEDKTPHIAPDMLTWAAAMEATDTRVASDTIRDVVISTVFLGLDHQHFLGPPLLFETMVFGGEQDGRQWRYTTWAEAEAGHAAVVKLVRREFIQRAG